MEQSVLASASASGSEPEVIIDQPDWWSEDSWQWMRAKTHWNLWEWTGTHKGNWKLWGQPGTYIYLLSLPTATLAMELQMHLAPKLKTLKKEIWWEQ